jgi:hypothetical protein
VKGLTETTAKAIGVIIVTILTAVIAIWWLYVVATHINVQPVVNASGAVVLDEYARAKDILLVVLPLFTATLAYWVGAKGTSDAKEETAEAKKQTEKTQAQLNAVVDVSDRGILKNAMTEFPEAF